MVSTFLPYLSEAQVNMKAENIHVVWDQQHQDVTFPVPQNKKGVSDGWEHTGQACVVGNTGNLATGIQGCIA
jgi:hypothetical protein